MVRKLKYHEQKLLKKVDFLQWSSDVTLQSSEVIRRYHLPNSQQYHQYNRLCGVIRKLANRLSLLNNPNSADSSFRTRMEQQLMHKLWSMGLVKSKDAPLSQCEQVTVSSFCR